MMQLDISVKYQRIAYKFSEGIIRIIIVLIGCSLLGYFFDANFELKKEIMSFGGFLLFILSVLIINETIDYNQKFYEILSNTNYLKVCQLELINTKIESESKFLNKIESQILASRKNWLISKKGLGVIEFQTRKKSWFNYLLLDKVSIIIKDKNTILIKSRPLNKIEFLDSSRNLGNIQFVKWTIKKI